MAPLSEDAIKALELMPVGLLSHETGDDDGDAQKLVAIKHTTQAMQKLSYAAYYINGYGGIEEAIPHAIFVEQAINELETTRQMERCLAFKKSCTGTALQYANQALEDVRTGVNNTDNNVADPAAERYTFHDFVVTYCLLYGHTEDRYNQREGLKFLKKPPHPMKVQRWRTILQEKNALIPYLQGTGDVYTDDEMKRIFFKSMPQAWQDTFTSNGNNDISTASMTKIFDFMKQQEATSRAKAASNKAKQATQRDSERSGNGTKRRTEEKGTSSRRSNKKRRGDDSRRDKTKNNDGKCTRCVHDHLWKDCLYNPNNPKNILGKLAAKSEKAKSKPNNKEEHNAHIDIQDSDHNHTGFEVDNKNKENKQASGKFESNARSSLPFTDITNQYPHELDCFYLHDTEQDHVHMTPHSNVSREAQCFSPGSLSETRNHTKSRTCGSNPNASDAREAEELRSATAVLEAISDALFNEEDDTHCGAQETFGSDVVNKTNSKRLSENEIAPGADTPMLIMTIGTVQGKTSKRPLRALVDSGSKRSYFYRSAIPYGAVPDTVQHGITTKLLDRTTEINRTVTLKDIILPELSATTRITQPFKAYVAEAEASSFDVILGQDFNIALGINVLNSERMVQWNENETPFRVVPTKNQAFQEMQRRYIEAFDREDDSTCPRDCLTTEILSSKYEMADINDVAEQQRHLTPQQRRELRDLLSQFQVLFNNELKTYKGKKVHLELKPEAKPVYRRHYPIAHAHLKVFKEEIDRLESIGVIKKVGASEWGLPSFCIPKKDNRIRFIADLRELNKFIKRKVYPLPKIADVVRRRSGYKYFTKLDVSMQYYTFELDDEAKKYCTVTTPFGNYEYQRLPMGLCQSPDFAQEVMESVLAGIPGVEVYIDDIAIFANSWEEHNRIVDTVLSRLQANDFVINPLKCEWAVKETDFLGHWMTPRGLKPWKKRVEAVLKLEKPKTIKDVRSFIGAVNFYRDMYPRRSHILAPLCELTGNKKGFQWEERHDKAFAAMKAEMMKGAFLRYPDHNKPFHVYTDASDLQLGSVIMQEGLPVAFYSRKLNAAQRNYTTIEKELLSIVETLREFRTMLYGAVELHVHTDHKNLTYANLNSQRVMRWRLYLEEYRPIFHYIKGEDNTFADALSRLPRGPKEEDEVPIETALEDHVFVATIRGQEIDLNNDESYHVASSLVDNDSEMLHNLLNFPDVTIDDPFTLDFREMANKQNDDAVLQQFVQYKPNQYKRKDIGNNQTVIVYQPDETRQPRVCIPDAMLNKIIDFYHQVLGHPGIVRLEKVIRGHFEHRNLHDRIVERVRTCDTCQRCKNIRIQYGELPERIADMEPWNVVALDLIGPWRFRDQHGFDHSFIALTIIDMATNYVEIIRLDNKTAENVARQFENNWIARYPKPNSVVFDPGTEFKGAFREMLTRLGIQPAPTTVKNPQANAVCERLHQTVGEVLRTLVYENPPLHGLEAKELVDSALATAAYAARASIHSTMGVSPASMIFHRDMLLDIPLIADLEAIKTRRQELIHKNLVRANRNRVTHHDYQPGQQVMKVTYNPHKLETRTTGPFRIQKVHTNGNVTIELTPLTTERLNIRRVRPYWSRTQPNAEFADI